MYNRYIPQPDGSYRKNRMGEPSRDHPHPEPHKEIPEPVKSMSDTFTTHHNQSVLGFLRNLLPKEFDTGDLIVVLLLLLMAEKCEDDQNTALLTLALYFFM